MTEPSRPRTSVDDDTCPVCHKPATLTRSRYCRPCTETILATVAREAHTPRWDQW